MQDRLFAYEVAMIVLAIVAGLALLAIIVLVRYFVIKNSK